MKQSYTKEFRDQIIKEIKEVGNVSLVCKNHNLKQGTVHGWIHRTDNKIQIAEKKQNRANERRIKDLELEVAVLRSLLKKTYPLWNNEKELL